MALQTCSGVITLYIFHSRSFEQGRGGYGTNNCLAPVVLNFVLCHQPTLDAPAPIAARRATPNESNQTQRIHPPGRGRVLETAADPPRNQGGRGSGVASTGQSRGVLRRRVLYIFICALSFAAATATFVVIVLKIYQANLTSIFSGGIQGIVLAIFSTSFMANAVATITLPFRVFRDAQGDDRSDPQARLETCRGLIMKAIEACVMYPAILLNFLRVHLQLNPGREVLDTVYDVAVAVFALGWIVLWFSGSQCSQEEDVKQGPTSFDPGATIMLTRGGQTPRTPGETPPTHFVRSNVETVIFLGT